MSGHNKIKFFKFYISAIKTNVWASESGLISMVVLLYGFGKLNEIL